MPSQHTIPPLLSSHLYSTVPGGSLSFVTSVLGASANWILLRHIYAALKVSNGDQRQDTAVILVSWLHGLDFWKDRARKVGLSFGKSGKVTFIDALESGLGLHQGGIEEVEHLLLEAIDEAKTFSTRVLLILDGIDFLLAATQVCVAAVLDTIWELREHVHATVVSASADFPLIQAQHSPLELNHAAFVMSVAHQARLIWGVRELDTGSARDVSGVLRITRGPAAKEDEEEIGGQAGEDAQELLYFIAGDGSVRVFDRGST